MTDQPIRRDLDAATGYQDLLVPALMLEWAPRVAEAAGIRAGDRVLDVACGTGVLTREAAGRAGPDGTVTGLDLSPEMLAVAARLSPALRWQQGSAEALPFPDHSFDAVVSQFGLMFFPDPVAGLREMMRVLVPAGGSRWPCGPRSPTRRPTRRRWRWWSASPGNRPATPLRAPFVLGDPKRLAELCAAAGITGARVALRPGRGRFSSIRTMVEVDVRDWLRIVGVTLDEDLIERILRESETASAAVPHGRWQRRRVRFAGGAGDRHAVKQPDASQDRPIARFSGIMQPTTLFRCRGLIVALLAAPAARGLAQGDSARAGRPVPTALAATGEHGENLYDAAKARAWRTAGRRLKALAADVALLATQPDADRLQDEVDSLRHSVARRQRQATMVEANQVTLNRRGPDGAVRARRCPST